MGFDIEKAERITWLSKLEKVFGARTKGPWSAKGVDSRLYEDGDHRMTFATTVENAEFIALCGTIGDAMLDVVKAADIVYQQALSPEPGDPMISELGLAVAKLRELCEKENG